MSPRRSEAVRISDVADAAGVSTTTVSHALSGKGRLSEETRQRVVAVARELGFEPNRAARNLAHQRVGAIGLRISSDQGDRPTATLVDVDFFMGVFEGASREASNRGITIAMSGVAGPSPEPSPPRLDGVVICDPVMDDPLIAAALAAGTPVVSVGRPLASEPVSGAPAPCPWVDNDNPGLTVEALDHLASQGARRIALLTGPPSVAWAYDARFAYLEWCAASEQEPIVAEVAKSLAKAPGMTAAGDLLDSDQAPDAIYSPIGGLLAGAAIAAELRGLSVPDDLLLAGGNASSRSNLDADPQLTGHDFRPDIMGAEAVKMLEDRIEGRASAENECTLPAALIVRESSLRQSP